jgi:hypothetical protein
MATVNEFFDYEGGADLREGMRELASEMYVLPFLTPQYCQVLIDAAEASGAFEANPHDPVPGHEVSIAQLSPVVFAAMQNHVGAYIWPQLKEAWGYIDYHGINDAFIIKYELGGQESLRIHHDVAQVSMSVKLNNNYTGAELEFPRQGVTNAGLAVGEVVAWPSLVTHPHASAPITGGVKYSLTIWCELPIDMGGMQLG